MEYTPLPDNNAMPAQEPGRKLARPLPFQPNANLVEFNTDASGELVAVLGLSNVASFVTKASHFAVYNNLADVPSLAAYPAPSPANTLSPLGKRLRGTGAVGAVAGDTAYDITVVGPNRFLRRYIGNVANAGVDATVEAMYHDAVQHGRGHEHDDQPKLKLSLHNNASKRVTFTIKFNNYSSRGSQHVTVAPRCKEDWVLDSCGEADGWYDLTITVSSDPSWSQRLTGHLETGRASISG